MTDSCCADGLLSGRDASRAAHDLGVRGFIALWRGERRVIGELTADETVVRELLAAGRLELDDGSVLVGVHGLVARATAHRIEHHGGTVYTWCALDAVGIPAALGLDATAITVCPYCAAELRVSLRDGEPTSAPELRLWLPGGSCASLLEDFCRHANLYCNSEHLAAAAPRDLPGRAVDVIEAAAIGRHTWRDVAAVRHQVLEEQA